MSNTWETLLDLGSAGEIECQIEYDFSPYRPGVHTLRNGDPGWPDEPEEIELIKVTTVHGIDITAMFDKSDWLLMEISQHEADKYEDAMAERAERERDYDY